MPHPHTNGGAVDDGVAHCYLTPCLPAPVTLSLPWYPHLFPLPSRSICLMLQAALPCLLFAPETSRLVLRGGTNADMAPPIDYVVQVGC